MARYGFGFLTFPAGTLSGRERFIDAPDELLRL
jgi:hypothetical protein